MNKIVTEIDAALENDFSMEELDLDKIFQNIKFDGSKKDEDVIIALKQPNEKEINTVSKTTNKTEAIKEVQVVTNGGEESKVEEHNKNSIQNTITRNNIKNTKDLNLPYAKNLALVEDETRFKEFGLREYIYKQIVIDGEKTKKFVCAVKQDDKLVVHTGLLSDSYAYIHLEKYFDDLKTKMNLKGEPKIYKKDPFILSLRSDLDINEFNVFQDDTDKTVFSLFTQVPKEELEFVSNNIHLQITNSYNGTRSLFRDLILSFSVNIQGKIQKFYDLFTLYNYSDSIEHLGKINNENLLRKDFHEEIKTNISNLKTNTKNIEKLIEDITTKLSKNSKEIFGRITSGLIGDMKNAYNVLIALSLSLGEEYKLSEFIMIRSLIIKSLS